MVVGVLILSLILAGVVAVVSSALIEVFRQLASIRGVLNIDDRPLPIALDATTRGSVDLPPEVRGAAEALIVFLSPKCGTCLAIAHAFHGGAPQTVWFVVEGLAGEIGKLLDTLPKGGNQVVVDVDGRIARHLGIDVTPSALTLQFGEITRAYALSSARQVLSLIPVVATAGFRDLEPSYSIENQTAVEQAGIT